MRGASSVDQPPKALLLDGGGLGGGVAADSVDGFTWARRLARPSRIAPATPPSPALPPLRRKGGDNALPLDGEGLVRGASAPVDQSAAYGPGVQAPPSRFDHDQHAPGATKRARRLRKSMPVSEKKLWEALRKLDLGIRRQAPIGRYVADFAHHGASLVVEVDGRRHDFPDAQIKDAERDAWLRSQGYRVIRIRDDLAYGRPHDVAERIGQIIRVRTGKMAAPNSALPPLSADTPPSPALPPLRRKGE